MGRWTMAKRNDGMDDGMMGRCDDGGRWGLRKDLWTMGELGIGAMGR